ncbi:2-(1,2-epoxy-1,2-dihydrophenyl)acetyl-CoA isomerase PaaG [Zavarzinia aquatilis]|uniref:2-(1,2-epoxy-1,2-dihydrophenyl)acetyl-CoA isomerase n=1 Tax=Zavarzinia aquatilis TaxID=2211142 RepID=A0A317DS98_9PROT|nr:2-(1,2-epoxy-1,2-dihydrophenyl)acetyl-CoA isomerase PaaG [Zavarzinia aquatilis]PWR17547.1 2-(1,2-epoxy-1,2-dihydrophenyl)acetyl-CoA isomerase [Zavarzinia aquatilis]
MEETQPVLLARQDGVAILTLNRPDKINSFNVAMHQALRAHLDTIEADPAIRAVVITGAGRGFCAGQDLADRATKPGEAPPDLGQTIETWYNPLVRRLRALPLPVIAAVNGIAAGAGANLALAADIVIAGRSAKFGQAFCKVGLLPDCGGTWILPRLVGQARAAGLALTGDILPAETALAWGLIWRVVNDAALLDEATAMARHLATQPTLALAAIKQALQASSTQTLDRQLDLERDLQQKLGRSEDYREGIDAFLNKRPAAFKGR